VEPEVLPIEEVLPACEPTEDWLPAEASGVVELLDGVCELAEGVELALDCEALASGVVLLLAVPGVELVVEDCDDCEPIVEELALVSGEVELVLGVD